MMPTKRKNNPVATTSAPTKRRRISTTYRGRRDAGTTYEPRQTRSRAALPGASPLIALDDDGKCKTRPQRSVRELDIILGTNKVASPTFDATKPESPDHALDELIMYATAVASKLNGSVALGLGDALDEVILDSVKASIAPQKASAASIDDQGELILDSVEPNDFVASDEIHASLVSLTPSPYPFEREGAPSPEPFLTTFSQFSSPDAYFDFNPLAPTFGDNYDDEGKDWSMFPPHFSFSTSQKRSNSDDSIDLYAIPEHQPNPSFEDIMNEGYDEDDFDWARYAVEYDDSSPPEPTFGPIYSDAFGCMHSCCQSVDPFDLFDVAEPQPGQESNARGISTQHFESSQQKQHRDQDQYQSQSQSQNMEDIDPALTSLIPLSYNLEQQQNTTNRSHPYTYNRAPNSDSDSSTAPPNSRDQLSPSFSSDTPSLQSSRSSDSSSDSRDSWYADTDDPYYDGDGDIEMDDVVIYDGEDGQDTEDWSQPYYQYQQHEQGCW